MKNDSPNKFLGGIASIAGVGQEQFRQLAQARQAVAAAPTAPLAPTADISAGAAMSGGAMDPTNLFAGKTFQITPANMKGNAKPVFNKSTSDAAAKMYGTPLERQMSMPKAGTSAMSMKDIPEGDKGAGLRKLPNSVVEQMGYDSATKMVSPASMVEFERDYVSDGSYANPETALDTGTGQAIADTISSIGASEAGAVGSGEGDGSKGVDRIKARGERQAARQANRAQRQAARKSRRNARKNK